MAVVFGRQTETTVYEDLAIANRFGVTEIRDTINRLKVFVRESENPTYLAELVAALNHNLWHFYQAGNSEYANTYSTAYEEMNEIFFEKWEQSTGEREHAYSVAYQEILD